MIIYGHKWLNLAAKNQEGWMIESKTRSRNVIRGTDNIVVKMRVKQIKKYKNNLFCNANFVFSDNQGGIFEVDLKALMA